MLLHREVQWQYTGAPRTAKGKGATSGIGFVRTDATRVMVYESASALQPAYTLTCRSIDGVFPLNTPIKLSAYILTFTRLPVHEAVALSATPNRQPPGHVAVPASSILAGGTQPSTAAPSTATVPAKRKATPLTIGPPPSPPARALVTKPTNRKRRASTATSTAEQVQVSRARKSALKSTPVASASATPTPTTSTKRRNVRSSNEAPGVLSSADPVASTSASSVSLRVNPLTPKEQETRERYRGIMEQWTQEGIARVEARQTRERALLQSLRMSEVGTSDGHQDTTENDLFDVINGRIGERTFYAPSLKPKSPARLHVAAHPATVRVLARLAAQPFLPPPSDSPALRRVRYDPFVSKSDGAVLEPTECEADNLGPEDAGAQFYLRSLVFPDVAAVRAFLSAYQDRFGDACWVETTLRSLQLAQGDGSSAIALQYAGLTIRASPGGRVDADLQLAGMSRCSNLLQFARELREGRLASEAQQDNAGRPAISLELILHEFVELRLPASTAMDANRPVIGDTEVALIAAIKPACVNSADGGRLLRVDPSALADLVDALASLGATRAYLEQLAPLDPVPDDTDEGVARMKRALDDSIAYLATHAKSEAGPILDRTTEGGQRAYADILANLTALRTRVKGRGFKTFEFILTKDITKGSLEGTEPFSSGNNSARGPTSGYLLDRLVQGADSSEQGWRDLTPSADLWAVILWHWLLLLALLFAARVLHIAQPLLLISHSRVVSNHFRRGHFVDLLDPNSSDLDAFLNAERATDPELVASVRSAKLDLTDHRDSNEGGWILTVGSTAIVRYGPLGQHITLHLSQLHPGSLKYNPLVQDEAVALFAAAAAKTALCRRVLAECLVRHGGVVSEEEEARLAFFRAARQQVEQVALESGLEEKLVNGRRTLADRYGAINSERKIAANQRRVEAGVVDEIQRRSAVAAKAMANKSARPAFVGRSLTDAEITALDAFFVNDRLRPADLPEVLTKTLTRLAALKTLLLRHIEAALDGLPPPAPEAAVGPVGSRPYCDWYLGAAEGVEIARSAVQVGNGKLRSWSDKVRNDYVEMCFARELLKRCQRGLELRGQVTLVDALRVLREDQESRSKGTAGRGSRRAVYISTCAVCRQVYLDTHHALRKDRHPCGADTFTRVPVLFSSTLALLLGTSLLALDAEGLPAYKEVTARSLIPDDLLATLPFDSALDPLIQMPLGTRPELFVPLAIDALLVTSRSPSMQTTPSERVLSIGGCCDAWSSNYEDTLYFILRGILRGVSLSADFCPTCLKSRIVPSDNILEQHVCEPAKLEGEDRTIAHRVRYNDDDRSLLPSQESLLLLGPEPYRRLLYALTDSRDLALSAFIRGLDRHGEPSDDAAVKAFRAETDRLSQQEWVYVFARRVLGWRQP